MDNYSYSDMANFLLDFNIPYSVIKTLADPITKIFFGRPVLNIFKFDDYLHQKYGKYEDEGKSMSDIFKELFGDKTEKAQFYFGIGEIK